MALVNEAKLTEGVSKEQNDEVNNDQRGENGKEADWVKEKHR